MVRIEVQLQDGMYTLVTYDAFDKCHYCVRHFGRVFISGDRRDEGGGYNGSSGKEERP